MNKMTITLCAAAWLMSPVALAEAPPADQLIDQLTRDLDPGHPAANPAMAAAPARAEAPSVPAIRPITAPAAPPAAPAAEPAPKKAGTPLSEATSKQGSTPLGEATRKEKAESGSGSWAMVGLSLIALFSVAVWLRRRKSPQVPWATSAHIETLSTSRIFGKHQVGLVRVGGRVLLVGYSDKGLTLLTELDEQEILEGAPQQPTPLSEPTARTFVEKIAAMRQGWRAEVDRSDPFQEALDADAPADELVRMDERAAIRERLDALRRRSIAVA